MPPFWKVLKDSISITNVILKDFIEIGKMISMNKFYAMIIVVLLTHFSTADAAIYKGQKIYSHTCKACHGSGRTFTASKKKRAWTKIMDNKGARLAKVHLSSKRAKASWDFFGDPAYPRNVKHLKDFLVKYAGDSGNVPACD